MYCCTLKKNDLSDKHLDSAADSSKLSNQSKLSNTNRNPTFWARDFSMSWKNSTTDIPLYIKQPQSLTCEYSAD